MILPELRLKLECCRGEVYIEVASIFTRHTLYDLDIINSKISELNKTIA